jgi:hypothetical protein
MNVSKFSKNDHKDNNSVAYLLHIFFINRHFIQQATLLGRPMMSSPEDDCTLRCARFLGRAGLECTLR